MLLVVSAIAFTLLASAGGDALSSLRDNPQVSEKTIANLRHVYGLDRPFAARYTAWLGGALRGDLGESFVYRVPVSGLVWSRFLNTAAVSVAALAIAILVSFLLAMLATFYRSRVLDSVIEAVVLLTASTPRMVLALVALVLMLRLSHTGGADRVTQFAATAVVLSVPLISLFLAQLRDALAGVMKEDFVRLARAKGLNEWTVVFRHAMRAAIAPFITIAGLSLGGLLGGSVIVEMVLGWQGIGALMVNAVRTRDVPLVMGIVLVASSAVWFGNALAELIQAVNDPRIREGEGA